MRTVGKVSVVAPVLNEEEIVELFHERVSQVLADVDFELVLVDDGSTDGTPEILEKLAAKDPRVGVIRFSRNFGYQAATAAGLDYASGDIVVTTDSDLQDPPELIPKLIEQWVAGADVVYAYRDERPGESWAKLATSRWFTRLFAKLARIDLPHNVGDFRLMDRKAVDALLRMREHARFMRGMAVWVGFTQTTVPYVRDPRYAGETRYRWGTLVRIAFDALTSFSRAPLQLATVIGFIVSGIAFLAIPLVIIGRIFGVDYAEGIPTVLLAVLLLGGIQLITLGIVGEYVSRVYEEVKDRPLYLVRATHNIDVEAAREARDAAAGRVINR
ncbi:MAG: polyisoprenyl-phosphate glycosyltransferase [Thermoleophilaceae bacterium]|jgi:dolichol-phosphate mannosyltransferase|nr:polyisoprenyl-phosphate glycosyltransferase [Thermoleophilaceae bacterium]